MMKTLKQIREELKAAPLIIYAHFKHVDMNLNEDVSLNSLRDNWHGVEEYQSAVDHHKDIKLQRQHKDSVFIYTDESKPINTRFISGEEHGPGHKKVIRHLDELTTHKENSFKHDVISHSGLSDHFGRILNQTGSGGTVHSPAYISSTLSKHMAHTFSKPDKTTGDIHFAIFHLPKGYTKAHYVNDISANPGEHELIHARNQTYKKIKTEHVPGRPSFGGKTNSTYYHHLVPVENDERQAEKTEKVSTETK